jgi:hypothetical protein
MAIHSEDRPRILSSHKNIISILCFFFVLILIGLTFSKAASAGPPFLTDDPEPVPYRHFEAYLFSSIDRTPDDKTVQVPAAEFNWGAVPEVQLHAVLPLVLDAPSGGSRQYGLGDIELGIKYRFIDETVDMPQVGIFPMVELPTGDADRGLGNGRTWYRLPIWLQKSWGEWTTFAGGGYVINPAPDQRDYGFGGWLLQRRISRRLILGGEAFLQGATAVGDRSTTFINFGGYYNVTPEFSILFSAGHSVIGADHLIGYLALYWTWGLSDSP